MVGYLSKDGEDIREALDQRELMLDLAALGLGCLFGTVSQLSGQTLVLPLIYVVSKGMFKAVTRVGL